MASVGVCTLPSDNTEREPAEMLNACVAFMPTSQSDSDLQCAELKAYHNPFRLQIPEPLLDRLIGLRGDPQAA